MYLPTWYFQDPDDKEGPVTEPDIPIEDEDTDFEPDDEDNDDDDSPGIIDPENPLSQD